VVDTKPARGNIRCVAKPSKLSAPNSENRPVPKATGKRYRTTSEMLEDTDTPQEIIDSVKEVERDAQRLDL
jgi:hypothetical protein